MWHVICMECSAGVFLLLSAMHMSCHILTTGNIAHINFIRYWSLLNAARVPFFFLIFLRWYICKYTVYGYGFTCFDMRNNGPNDTQLDMDIHGPKIYV